MTTINRTSTASDTLNQTSHYLGEASLRQETTTTDSGEQQELLERPINLSAIPAESIAWIVVATVAIGVRLIGRTNWPLSPAESSIARDAWALAQGTDLSTSADAHPATIQLTSLFFFLFGSSDGAARLLPFVAGIGMLAALYWLRAWFGNLPALSIAIIWTISPVMAYGTTRLDGGALLALSVLLTLALTMILHVSPDRRKAVVLGIAVAIGLTSHPIAWLVLPVTILTTMALTRGFRLGGQSLPAIASFLGAFLVITSWFATRITAIPDFFDRSLAALWGDHLADLGSGWQATLVVLMVDEPLLLIMSAVGLAVIVIRPEWNISSHPAIFISCLTWVIPMITLGLLLANKGPGLYTSALLPLVVVAGLGLSMLLDGLASLGWRGGHPALWGVVLLGLMIAIVRFAESLASGPGDDSVAWLVNVAAIGLLILLPLGYLIIRLSAGTGWHFVSVAIIIVTVIVAAIGLRTTLMLPGTGADRPGELLRAGSSTLAVGSIEHRLRTYSRDATMNARDVRDPEGVYGLMIVVQDELADPFAWYFREFPNLLIVEGPDGVPSDVEPDVVIAPDDQSGEWMDELDGPRLRAYPWRFEGPDSLSDSTYAGLLMSAVNPVEYPNLFTFGIYRDTPELLEPGELSLILRSDHADAIWGPEAEND